MSRLLPRLSTVRRFLYVAAVALWLGGFTFYGAVVIPIGMRVLGSHLRQGFITQQVTARLNWIALAALPLLFWNMAAVWPARRRVTRACLASTWAIMALIQVGLIALHPMLDRLLDPRARSILDEGRFDLLHRIYLAASTVQWAAGVVHVWCVAAE